MKLSNLFNYKLKSLIMIEEKEKIVIDIGMVHTKLGTTEKEYP